MDTKEREWFNERVTTEMNKIVEELEDKKVNAQPEPQAGDVWCLSGAYAYVYQGTSELEYIYEGGTKGMYTVSNFHKMFDSATRIFSLQEYLKDKEEGK